MLLLPSPLLPFLHLRLIALHDVFIKIQGETQWIDTPSSPPPPPRSYPTIIPTAWLAQEFGYFEDGSWGRSEGEQSCIPTDPPLGSTHTHSATSWLLTTLQGPQLCLLLLPSPKPNSHPHPCNRDSTTHPTCMQLSGLRSLEDLGGKSGVIFSTYFTPLYCEKFHTVIWASLRTETLLTLWITLT